MDWINTNTSPPTNKRIFYWVYGDTTANKVILARLNDYMEIGGKKNYWQTLGNDDFPLEDTLYKKVDIPLVPKKEHLLHLITKG